jgi:hypothetical protein
MVIFKHHIIFQSPSRGKLLALLGIIDDIINNMTDMFNRAFMPIEHRSTRSCLAVDGEKRPTR